MATWKKVIVSGSSAELASLRVADLTEGKLVIAGVNGELENSVFDYDGTTLDLTAATTISGSSFVGTSFSGDGSGLSNITAVGLDIDTFGQDHSGLTLADSDKIAFSKGGQEGRIRLDDVLKHSYAKISNASGTEVTIDSTGKAEVNIAFASAVTEGTLTNIVSTAGTGNATSYQVDVDLTEAPAGSIAAGDNIIFLDGGASGTHAKGSINDIATLFAGTGLTATAGVIAVDYGSTANTAAEGDTTIEYTATAGELTVDAGSSITLGAGGTVTYGLADTITGDRTFQDDITIQKTLDVTLDGTFGQNVVIQGDLTVNGTTTSVNTTTLDVEDRYILINSGSSTSSSDSGIVFGGTNGVAQEGAGLIWDASYNTGDGRLAVVADMAGDSAVNETPAYHVVGAGELTEAQAATAKMDHVGNIRVESGEIYIYV